MLWYTKNTICVNVFSSGILSDTMIQKYFYYIFILGVFLFSSYTPIPTQALTTNTSRDEQSLLASFSYILKNGVYDSETGGEVSALQRFLTHRGFHPGPIDGIFGPLTSAALEAYKKSSHQEASAKGIFDPREYAQTSGEETLLRPMHLFLGSDEVFFYRLPQLEADEAVICGEISYPLLHKEGETFALLTFPYGAQTTLSCSIHNTKEEKPFLTLHKKENKKVKTYASFSVPQQYTQHDPEQERRVQEEKEMLSKRYHEHEQDPAYFSTPFLLPLSSEMISPFGKMRIINGKVSSYHSGVDFRARTPTPVRAANDGIVLYTGNLFYCGNTVIVNHGAQLFTAYCHLSDIGVHEGDKVSKGEIIGKTGATGRVSGPHLHLSTKFQSKYMDFMKVYEYSKVLAAS